MAGVEFPVHGDRSFFLGSKLEGRRLETMILELCHVVINLANPGLSRNWEVMVDRRTEVVVGWGGGTRGRTSDGGGGGGGGRNHCCWC